MTWEKLLKAGTDALLDAGIGEAGLDAWYLFERAFGMSRARYYLCARDEASASGADAKAVVSVCPAAAIPACRPD